MSDTAKLRTKLVLGVPGSGKSYSGRHDIKAAADAGDTTILVEDFHGALHDDVLGDIGLRHESRIEVLDMDRPEDTFGIEIGALSDDPNPTTRKTQDDYQIERVLELMNTERAVNLNTAPLTGLWSRNALRLRWRQTTPKPLTWAKYALRPWHPNQLKMIADCFDRELAAEFLRINEYQSAAQQDVQIGAGRRLLDGFLEHEFVDQLLSKPSVPIDDWVAAHKILLFRASVDTPETAGRPIFGFLRYLFKRAAMRHLERTGKPIRMLIYADETARLGVSRAEVNLDQQTRKAGVQNIYVYQSPLRTDEFRDLVGTAKSLEVFAQGSADDAEWCARELLALMWDMQKAKSVERRERVVNRGMRREEIKTTSARYDQSGRRIGSTTGTQIVSTPDLETVVDEHVILASHGDQLADLVQATRRLTTGERLVINGQGVVQETVPEVKSRWPSKESRDLFVRELLARIRSRPHYRQTTPSLPPAKKIKGGFAKLREEETRGS